MILKFNKKYYHLSLTVLIIVFLVGLIGLNTPYQEQITALTPYSLLLTTVLILLNHREWNRYFVVYFLFCVISGFLVELIGIETRMIFGDYSFGQKLGYKVYAVPIVIGLNWFIMVYSTAMVANIFRFGIFIKAIIGATLMVIIDYSLEPVAMALDYWSWENSIIPLQNYIAWFIISFVLNILFQSLRLKKFNQLAVAVYIIQYIFFFVLSYTL